jgi:hypothetical protein
MIRSKTPVPGPRAWSSSPASRSASASRRRLRKRIPPPIEVRLLTVAEGELIYVNATDCVQRPYRAGTSFVDPGRPNVHTAFRCRRAAGGLHHSSVKVAVWLSSSSMVGSRTRAGSSASVRMFFAPRLRTRVRSTPSCGR